MSRNDDDYQDDEYQYEPIDDAEPDDDESDDEDADSSGRSSLSPFASRPSSLGSGSGNRFGDSSRLPGGGTPPGRSPLGGPNPPAPPRPPLGSSSGPGLSRPGGSSSFSRPGSPPSALPPARGGFNQAPPGSTPRPFSDSTKSDDRPGGSSSFSRPGAKPTDRLFDKLSDDRPSGGSKSGDRSDDRRGSTFGSRPSPFSARDRDEDDDDEKETGGSGKSGPFGLKPATPRGDDRFSSSSSNRPSPFSSRPLDKSDERKEDRPATPFGSRSSPFGAKSSDKPDNKPSGKDSGGGLGGLTSRLGGDKKDDKKGEKGGGLAARLGGLPVIGGKGDKDSKGNRPQERPATPRGAAPAQPKRGGFLSRLRRGGGDSDKSTASSRPGGQAPSPFAARSGATVSPAPSRGAAAAAAATKTPRPSIRERIRNFSLFKKPDPKGRVRTSKAPTVKSEGMSLDTRLDILGVVLVLSSLGLVFSAMSPTQGQLTGSINTFLAQTFGWGALAVPIAMFAIGVWLILRHFGDEAPVLDTMRVIGLLILYVGLLVLFQYIDSFNYRVSGPNYLEELRDIYLFISYQTGQGGGWVGAEIYFFLVSNLTEIGGFFVLLAWLIIGVMLTLSLSAAEMAIIVISVWRSFADARKRRAQRAAVRAAERAAAAAQLPQIAVSRPPAEQLPASSSPALPAPTEPEPEPRRIPITRGGRTVTASFRPVEAVPLETGGHQPPLPLAATTEHPAATTGDNGEKAGGLRSRFGGFASRVRGAIPTPVKASSDADTKPADKVASEKADDERQPEPGASRVTGPFSRVRETVSGGPSAEPPARAPGNGLPAASAVPAEPIKPPSALDVSFSQAETPPVSLPKAIEAGDDEDGEAPVSFGSLLRPSPPAAPPPPTASPPERRKPAFDPLARLAEPPAADATADAPAAEPAPEVAASTAPPAEAAPAKADESETTTPEPASWRSRFARPSGTARSGADSSPFRGPVPPPVARPPKPAENGDGDDSDAEDEEDLQNLPPARPKGIGPLPRPATAFGRPAGRDPALPPADRKPMPTLQERLAALRGQATADDAPEKADEAATEPAAATTTDADTTVSAEPTTASLDVDTAPATAAEEPAPVAEASAPSNGNRPDSQARTDDTSAKPEEMPTLTQPRSLGIKPPPAPDRKPAAMTMPEGPTPPAPSARSAAFAPASAPPPQQTSRTRREWELPDYRALLASGSDQEIKHDVLLKRARIIEETLASFGAPGRVVEVRTGPVITQFGVEPDYLPGRNGKKIRVKVGSIAQLDKDLQLALGAKSIRIEAPVPGKGYVGIEVPNEQPSIVRLRDVLESNEFRKINSPLAICLGQGVDGTPVAADLAAMPHLLIAGTTGSGKSVAVNTIIASLLLRNGPDRLKMIMVDPKRVELTGYNGIPHLVAPVVVELERIVSVLKWVTREMDERYKKFASAGARNIEDYNKHLPQGEIRMPYIVVIIDELADLMMLAPDETERVITRIAALARATGIHLVIATQRPSVDVVTGLIKANFPARIAFAVASMMDSRVILDQPGAERLLGRGDMLYMSGDSPAPVRLQGVFVSDNEINNITRYWRAEAENGGVDARPTISQFALDEAKGDLPTTTTGSWAADLARGGEKRPAQQQTAFWDRELSNSANNLDDEDDEDGDDALYEEAVEMVRRLQKASVSLLQRRLRIGYTRAARLIDLMEERGVVGPPTEGSKPREVLPVK